MLHRPARHCLENESAALLFGMDMVAQEEDAQLVMVQVHGTRCWENEECVGATIVRVAVVDAELPAWSSEGSRVRGRCSSLLETNRACVPY